MSYSVRPILVRSQDRTLTSVSSQNFNVDLSAQTHEPISKVVVRDLAMDHTWKNINTNTNTIYFLEEDGNSTPVTVTVPFGNYNATELATYLSTIVTAQAVNTYTFVYDLNFLTFTITTSGTSFNIDWAQSKMNRILGFTRAATGVVATAVSDLSPIINGIKRITIRTSAFNRGIETNSPGGNNDNFLSLPITTTLGEILTLPPQLNYTLDLSNFHSQVHFRVTCDYNNGEGIVDLPSDSDWSMGLYDIEAENVIPVTGSKKEISKKQLGFV